MTQETTNADAAQTPQGRAAKLAAAPTGYLSLPWARALLQRCAAAENRIREEFAPDDGRQPEDASDWPADECQRWLEGWAIGNLSARRAALQAHRDLESERKLPISVFASEPVEVKAISGALLLKSGRVRLALTNQHAAAVIEAMRALLPADARPNEGGAWKRCKGCEAMGLGKRVPVGCGWTQPNAPTGEQEPPIVRGALDAQAEAERRMAEANALVEGLRAELAAAEERIAALDAQLEQAEVLHGVDREVLEREAREAGA